MYNLHDISGNRSNNIINNLDSLLAEGSAINDLVREIDDVRIVANYNLLVQKGATNIDLATVKDRIDPIVVLNNTEVFKKAHVPIDLVETIYRQADRYRFSRAGGYDVKKWVELGANPQILADKFVYAKGYDLEAVRALLDAGAFLDANAIINNLLEHVSDTRNLIEKTFDYNLGIDGPSDYLRENFNAKNDVPMLERAGASEDAIGKILKQL